MFTHPFSIKPLKPSPLFFVQAKPLENCRTYTATIPIVKDTSASAQALGYILLKFFHIPVVALLDTGASISGIPYHLYNKLKEIPNKKPNSFTIHNENEYLVSMANGHKQKTSLEVKITFSIGGHEITSTFLVW